MNRKDRFIHKHGYGFLFSNPEIVRELLESFIDKDLAASLDFTNFEAFTEKTYITDDFTEYADDLLTKVEINGKDAYIYLLIEFQSTPDHFMALRILNYISLFYLEYVKEHPGITHLPPVLPVLLYNGRKDWTSPENIKDLIEPYPFLSEYYPDLKYFKIIEKDYSREDLKKIGNAVSAIFFLENTPKEEFDTITEELSYFLDKEQAATIGLLSIWMKQLYKNERITKETLSQIYSMKNEKEAKSMLVETVKELQQDWLEQGIQQGVQQGIQQGVQQGIQQGVQQGAQQEDRVVAVKMKDSGVSMDIIVHCTGLSEEEIKKL